MSPSTPDRAKTHIPFQPNPFGSAAFESPWAGELTDVPAINDKPFRLILTALRQMRAGAKGTSIVLTGDPGSGKTHLLGRLSRRLWQDEREGNRSSFYVYVRCNASAGTLWRHLRHALASDLIRGPEGSQLRAAFQSDSKRLENVNHGGVRLVLECLRDGRHFHAAAAWLRGELLGDADLAALGLGIDKEDEDHSRERDAKLVVDAILSFLAPTPVVLCFDQVEALETYRGETAGYHAMAQLISALNDGHNHLLLISCVVSAFEKRLDELSNGADKDRWLRHKDTLRPIDLERAAQLVRTRLDNASQLKALRLAHSGDPWWPLDAALLQPLFAETGLCLPRTLIRACERQFAELLIDEGLLPPPKSLEALLRDEYASNLLEARRTVARQCIAKTLSDCLPWLLQNSRLIPLGQDEERSRYAHQAWRGAGGDMALAFCDGGGIALTNQLKRIDSHWTPQTIKLTILRDAGIMPGEKAALLLERLKQRGAREVHPLPEALAALQAIRNLISTARSGELFLGDQKVDELAVTDWALANLPLQVTELHSDLLIRLPEVQPHDSAAVNYHTFPKLRIIDWNHALDAIPIRSLTSPTRPRCLDWGIFRKLRRFPQHPKLEPIG
jgi:GTPase SAR1 family protein